MAEPEKEGMSRSRVGTISESVDLEKRSQSSARRLRSLRFEGARAQDGEEMSLGRGGGKAGRLHGAGLEPSWKT